MPMLAIEGGDKAAANLEVPDWPQCDTQSITNVTDCLESGAWCRKTPRSGWVTKFETRWADYHDADHALAVNSGTVALKIALRASGITQGDEVLLPSYTFRATASALLDLGAVPRFVDVNPNTYTIDTAKLPDAITPDTKAIIAVHFSGYPADLDSLCSIADTHELTLIEDAAQAHNSEWRGQRVGSFGDVGIFSFQDMKILPAGEGGALITDDETIYNRAKAQHDYLNDCDTSVNSHPATNFRLSELHAALLCAQLDKLPEFNSHKQHIASRLRDQLRDITGIKPKPTDDRITNRGYYHFTFRYDSSEFDDVSRMSFLRALAAEGVPVHLPAFNRPLYQKQAFSPEQIREKLPNSVSAALQQDLSHEGAEQITSTGAMFRHPLLLVEEDKIDLVAESIEKIQQAV